MPWNQVDRIFILLVVSISPAIAQAPAQAGAVQGSSARQNAAKGPIKARTHEEYVAYQAAIANKSDPEAMAKAAEDFAAKFPDSPIRALLYRAEMKSYQTAGEPEKMMDAGMKLLSLNKNDPEALIVVAEVQEAHTTAMDLDREQRMNQATANAQHALETIDTDLAVPVGTPPEKLGPYKQYLRAAAYAIIGSVEWHRQQYADAESSLRKSLDADPEHPDEVVLLRLALALDAQKKYEDALQQAGKAVELTKEETDAGRAAREERDRLTMLIAEKAASTKHEDTKPQDPAPASH